MTRPPCARCGTTGCLPTGDTCDDYVYRIRPRDRATSPTIGDRATNVLVELLTFATGRWCPTCGGVCGFNHDNQPGD